MLVLFVTVALVLHLVVVVIVVTVEPLLTVPAVPIPHSAVEERIWRIYVTREQELFSL